MKAFVVPVLLAAALPFLSAVPANVQQGAENACVEVGGASVWGGIGWTHLVYLTNDCEETVTCRVTTNVEPEPRVVTVEQGVTVLVVTTMNAPTQPFVPSVTCEPAEVAWSGQPPRSELASSR